MSANYPTNIFDNFYRSPRENPSYGADFPHDLPYDPGATSSLFELNYFPNKGISLLLFLILFVCCLLFLPRILKKENNKIVNILRIIFFIALSFTFLGPLRVPSILKVNTILGLVKMIGLGLTAASGLIFLIKRKPFEFLKIASLNPFLTYAASLLISIFTLTNITFFWQDLTIILTGFIFFYLGFYFFDWKEGESFIKNIAVLLLVPVTIIFVIFLFRGTGVGIIASLYPRYENFVFSHDLDRGRIFSIIDFEYFLPAVIFLYLISNKKRDYLQKALALLIFTLTTFAVLLVNYRYRFLTFLFGAGGMIGLLKKGKKKIILTMSMLFTTIFCLYLVISIALGRTTLIDRFLLKSYRDDVDSLRRRIVMIGQAWELFTEHPVFGVGVGNYRDNVQVTYERFGGRTYEPYYKILQNVYAYPHNWYLLVLAENGIVGFLILMWLLFSFLKIDLFLYKRLTDKKLLVFLSFALISYCYLFANLFTMMHNSLPMVIIFWACRGMIERIYYEYPKE